MNNTAPLINAEGITKIYRRGSEDVHALRSISLEIRQGEFIAFTGPSGSGKTTLINILGCLDNPTAGSLSIAETRIFADSVRLSETQMTYLRRKYFGYIFQSFYLIPTLTVYENTILPYTFYDNSGQGDEPAALLEMLGLKDRLKHMPSELSGGEMQRVALARSLVNNPRILLADEPTGNLDVKRSTEVGELLQNLNRDRGLTIIMVTHNTELARMAGRIVSLSDGLIASA